jgi:hypothetical protein
MDRELGIENVHVRERCTDEQWALVVAEHERRMKSRPMPTLIATSVPLPPAEGKKGKEPSTS